MDAKRYMVVMKENEGEVFDVRLSASDVGLLNSAVGFILASRQIHAEYSEEFIQTMRDLQGGFVPHFQRMGFTPEEIEYLSNKEEI